MNIVKVKGCKRCGGDLFLERDYEGVYVSCLQCGATYMLHIKEERKEKKRILILEDLIFGDYLGRCLQDNSKTNFKKRTYKTVNRQHI